jgi:hypothetical protein
MDLGEIGWGGMGWIDVTQKRDKWRALVNAVMDPRCFQWLNNWRLPKEGSVP